MNESRNAHAITMCKGNVFVLGGFSGKQRLNSVEKYTVKEDKWTQMAVMKDKRHYLSACTINDEFIYAFGGFFGSTEQEINDTIEVYEVEKNQWSVLTVRMKVSPQSPSFLTLSFVLESSLGLQCTRGQFVRDHPDWRKKHEQKRRGAPLQREQQDLEVAPLDELAESITQVLLLPGEDLRDRWRLRYELRGVRY